MALTKITTGGITDATVATADIAADAVTSAKIADNAVVTAAINASAITEAKLDTNAVTTNKIVNSAINQSKLADASINAAKIQSGAVTQTKIGDGSIINVKVDNSAAIAGTKISPDFGSQNVITDGNLSTGPNIKTNVDGGGHMYFKNNSQGANYSSHFQTYLSSDEGGTTQTHLHYYHGGYSELLYQGNSSVRTRSGGGVEFRNGNSTKIGTFDPDGLKFGTDTAAANALDDYEEGTFTPQLAGFSSISYHRQDGFYTKIGRQVWMHVYLYVYQATGNSNKIRITNLPFTSSSANSGYIRHGGALWYQNDTFKSSFNSESKPHVYIDQGSTEARFVSQAGSELNGEDTYLGEGANNRYIICGLQMIV
jgi:hypothetical protein